MNYPFLRLIQYFESEHDFKTLGGYPYTVYIFLKDKSRPYWANYAIKDSVNGTRYDDQPGKLLTTIDFEVFLPNTDQRLFDSVYVHSGKRAFRIDSTVRFSPGFCKQLSDVYSSERDIVIKATAFIYPTVPFNENSTWLSVVTEKDQKKVFYKALQLEEKQYETNQWKKIVFAVRLPEDTKSDETLKVYFWHRGNHTFYLDDFKVELIVP
jgi:hypothetical protein